jgi:phytoene dehydrogenase-like protein
MGKRVIVIGAGIAGLSAASYLQRNGFDTEIFELHSRAGGLCTSWKRDGYTFDGCIHWLMGSGKTSNLNWIWKELGAGELRYIEWDVYTTARLSDGDIFAVHTDPERLRAEMLRLGPEDGAPIGDLVRLIRRAKSFDMPAALDRASLGEKIGYAAMLPSLMPFMAKYMKMPLFDLVS